MTDYRSLIMADCDRMGIIPRYVLAIIQVESAGVAWKSRYEPGWSYYELQEYWANKLGQTLETEMMGQRTSWGPMQVMGGTARHLGFAGYFPELCTPSVGVHFGMKYLAQQLKKYGGNYSDAIAAYNAGSARKLGIRYANQTYVDKVMAHA